MDIKNARRVLKMIESGQSEIKQVNTTITSPFAFNLVAQCYLDVLKYEEQIEFIRRIHQAIVNKIGT